MTELPPPQLPPPPAVTGISLAGAAPYVITREENIALCATLRVDPASDGSAHPIYFFIATQVGMGKSVAGMCAACEFDVEDGPLLASTAVTFSRPLFTEQPYLIGGEIRGLTRKRSRTLGVMDLLDYVLRLSLPGGEPVVETSNVWVLPRRNLA
jgi:hypothetical protein